MTPINSKASHRITFKSLHEKKWFFYIGLLATYLLLISFGFGPYITDDHPFRQTQTAITARYLDSILDMFAYQTPVLGPPWSIPFEFPLYQAITKLISEVSGVNLVLTGRLVSVSFFLLCFWPIARILDGLKIERKAAIMAMILLTPLYVFWSRAFMIESTALFFTLLYSSEIYRLSTSPYARPLELMTLFAAGAIAGLVKITTLIPVLVVACAYLAYRLYKRRADNREVRRIISLLAVHVMIFLVALVWVKHTDAIKTLNPIGTMLTSDNLRAWNFGAISQRFDPYIWFRLLNNVADIYFPSPRSLAVIKALGAIFLAGAFFYFFSLCNKFRRRQVTFLLFLFLLPLLIFTNLHRIHNYYQCANAVFLSMAIGVAMTGALEASTKKQREFIMVLYLIIISLFIGSSIHYFNFKSSESYQYHELTDYLQRHTSENSVLLITGMEYSSHIPFYADRRALMLPEPFVPHKNLEQGIQKTLDSGETIGAYLQCGPDHLGDMVRQYLRFAEAPDFVARDCKIYLPNESMGQGTVMLPK